MTGIPGIGDKTASELLQSFGSLEGVLSNVESVSGPKRKQNLIEHADDARVSKRLATVRRGIEVDFDIAAEAAREPDRSLVREMFRRYELRDPLRRLEEALGDPEVAAPRAPAQVALTARVRAGAPEDIGRLGGSGELCVAVRANEPPEGALFGEGAPWLPLRGALRGARIRERPRGPGVRRRGHARRAGGLAARADRRARPRRR